MSIVTVMSSTGNVQDVHKNQKTRQSWFIYFIFRFLLFKEEPLKVRRILLFAQVNFWSGFFLFENNVRIPISVFWVPDNTNI